MRILVTGGCGYVGTVLVERLLQSGHEVVVVDTQWFGNKLAEHENLVVVNADVRDVERDLFDGLSTVVHLANIANDPGVDLNPNLSWEVNVLASMGLIEKAIAHGASSFIYASSGSVYGIKDEERVTEDLELTPISTYNKTKMISERVLMSYADKIKVFCVRPATVCGWSPRLRLDLTVNMLTFQALESGKITVFGGDQFRPNIHIIDLVRVYEHFVDNVHLPAGMYNAGFENMSVLDIAKAVTAKVEADIVVSASHDPRSYKQDSQKLLATGFTPRLGIDEAIRELISKYQSGGIVDRDENYNVKWMKKIGLAGAEI